MPLPRIAVLHHEDSFFPLDLLQRARDVAEVIWVVDKGMVSDSRTMRLLRRLGEVIEIAGLDDDAAAVGVGAASPDGVLTFADALLPRAAAIAQRLGLRYHSPEVAGILTDKARQREALSAMPGAVAFATVHAGASANELADIVGRVGLPAVLKPLSGTGSRGMRLVRDVAELDDLVDTSDAHLLEEYLPDCDDLPSWAASYLSVETVVADGVVHHVALTGRFPTASRFRETGTFIPAVIGDGVREEVLALTDRIIATLGIRDSVLHTEIKLTPDGPRLIEINGRLGGSAGDVLAEVSDVNLHAVAFRVAAGVPFELDTPAALSGVGFRIMIQPPEEAEQLVAIDGLDEIGNLPGVHLLAMRRGPGDRVDWREGTASHIMSIRGSAPDHRELSHLTDSLRSTLLARYV